MATALTDEEAKAFLTSFPGYGDSSVAALAIDGAPSDGTWVKIGRRRVDVTLTSLYVNKDTIAPFTYLQDGFKELTRLESLRIAHAPVSKLPALLGDVSTLTSLQCDELLELEEVEDGFWETAGPRLESLCITTCPKLPPVPDALRHCARLTTLNMSTCRLSRVPEALASLPRLRQLQVFKNHLTELPPYWSLPHLHTLDVSHNQLAALPNDLCTCRQLTRLDVSHNRLLRLPDDIGRLNQLTAVDMSHNVLGALPSSIGFLRVMYDFNAGYNHLVELPETVSRWTALQSLDLEGNKLEEIPKTLRRLTRLTTMRLRGNPLFSHRTDSYGRDILELQLKRILEERRLEREMREEDEAKARAEEEAERAVALAGAGPSVGGGAGASVDDDGVLSSDGDGDGDDEEDQIDVDRMSAARSFISGVGDGGDSLDAPPYY